MRSERAFLGVVIELDLAAADSPNDIPTVIAREPAQLIISQRVEKPQLSRMRDKMFGAAGELSRDNASHRIEQVLAVFVHGQVNHL